MSPWRVRPETRTDWCAIDALMVSELESPEHAARIHRLRAEGALTRAFVLDSGGAIVGFGARTKTTTEPLVIARGFSDARALAALSAQLDAKPPATEVAPHRSFERAPARRARLAMIFAVAANGALGRAGRVPWDLPDDRAHFDRTTRGHAVIMGRRTWEETGQPLPGRRNVVVSRTTFERAGSETAGSLREAWARCLESDPMPFVIGGARLFEEAAGLVTRVYATEVPGTPEADVFLRFDRAEWDEIASWPGAQGERYRVLAPPDR